MRRRNTPKFDPRNTIKSFRRNKYRPPPETDEGVEESKSYVPQTKDDPPRQHPEVVRDPRSPSDQGRDLPDPRSPATEARDDIARPPGFPQDPRSPSTEYRAPPGKVAAVACDLETAVADARNDVFSDLQAKATITFKPRKRARIEKPCTLWTTKYQPQTVVGVQGNVKAKEDLKKWWDSHSDQRFVKPCLLVGDTGIGKTSLGRVFLKAKGRLLHFTVSPDVAEDFASTVSGYDPESGITVLLDDIHLLTTEERKRVVKLAERTRCPIIFTVDRSVMPQKYQTLKKICQVINMYKPYNNPTGDAVPLLRYIARKEGLNIPRNAFNNLVAESNGDLRALVVSAEMWARCPAPASTTERDDYSSTFQTASAVLQNPDHDPEACDRHVNSDSLIPLFVHENAPRVVKELSAEMADVVSLYDVLDSHPSHELHRDASSVLAQGVGAFHRCALPRAKIAFPAVLGNISKRNGMRGKFSGKSMDELSYLAGVARSFNPRTKKYKSWLAEQRLTTEQAKLLKDRFV